MGLVALFLLGFVSVEILLIAAIVRDARHPSRATIGWALARGLPPDPMAIDIPFEERQFGNGQALWSIDTPNTDSNLLTIIVHGWRRSRIDSLRRIHPWIGSSRRLLLVDLPGHGESQSGPSTLGIDDHKALVSLALEELAQLSNTGNAPQPRLLLVGHSLGAGIALRAAHAIPPECVAGVVALAPYESLSEPLTNRMAARGVPPWPLTDLAAWWIHETLGDESSLSTILNELRERSTNVLLFCCSKDCVVRASHVMQLAQATQTRWLCDEVASHDDLGTEWSEANSTPCATAAREFLAEVTTRTRNATCSQGWGAAS